MTHHNIISEHTRLFQAIFEKTPIGIAITDLTGRFAACNAALEKMLGFSQEELRTKDAMDIIHPDDVPSALPLFRELIEQEREYHQDEVRFLCKDGTILRGRVSVSLVEEKDGIPRFMVGMFEDITERKRAEEEIEILNENLSSRAAELEAANLGLEEFNQTVSHDLRTPLTNINGCCHVIRELCGSSLDELCMDFLHTILEETKRMDQLIDTLLNFSQLARCEVLSESVNLSSMAKTIASELRFKCPERRVTFTIADRMPATGDPRLLRVVLENLLDNAWKFTSKRKTAHIEVGITESEGKPVYFVRDNGAGFDMMGADRLFTPFCRLHTRADFKGHGIGLATVARIIHRHGGSVWAEGKQGKGATFYFTL